MLEVNESSLKNLLDNCIDVCCNATESDGWSCRTCPFDKFCKNTDTFGETVNKTIAWLQDKEEK